MSNLFLLLLIFGIPIVVSIVVWLIYRHYVPSLRRDKNNPYTYYCKDCGQEFNTYGYMGCNHCDKLRPVGEIINPECKCRKIYYGLV